MCTPCRASSSADRPADAPRAARHDGARAEHLVVQPLRLRLRLLDHLGQQLLYGLVRNLMSRTRLP
jgi:hypothetical protein